MIKFRQLIGVAFALTAFISTAHAANPEEAYYNISIKSLNLGNYEIQVTSYEYPSNEVLPIISSDYFTKTDAYFHTEVDNTAPSALYHSESVAKVDVVFALGETDQAQQLQSYIPTFTSLLESAGNYIDANVQQVETSTIDMSEFGADVIFNSWRKMPASTGRGEKIWKLDMSEGKIYAEGVKTLEGRHTSTGIIDDSEDGFATTDFTMSFTHTTRGPNGEASYRNVINGWSSHISGVMFRYTEDSSGVWDAYMLIIGDTGDNFSGDNVGIPFCGVIKVRNGDADFLPGTYYGSLPIGWCTGVVDSSGAMTNMEWVGTTYQTGVWQKGEYNAKSDMLPLGARAIRNTNSHDFTLEVTGNNIKVYCGGILQLDLYDTYGASYDQGTYGLFSYSSPNIYFSNFKITRGTSMSLGQAISNVEWRDGSARFIIHASDIIPDDMLDLNSSEYQYTLIKLLNTNGYLINLGRSDTQEAMEGLGEKLNTADGEVKHKFILNNAPDIETAMREAEKWIEEIVKKFSKPSDWVLVGDEVLWTTTYNDSEKDVPLNYGDNAFDTELESTWGIGIVDGVYTESKLLAERWRYRHYPEYYDNSFDTAIFNGVWIPDPVEVFNYPGKYRINYKRKDNPFYTNASTSYLFDVYRYFSTDYDRVTN